MSTATKQAAGLDISALMRDEFVVEVPFDPELGAYVSISYISREELLALRKKATVKQLNHKTRAMEEDIDSAKADVLLCRRVVKGWRGFKVGDQLLEYSPEQAEFLMKKWTRFAKFVNDVCDDLEALTQAERENDGKK